MPLIKIEKGSFSDLGAIATWLGFETPAETVECLIGDKLNSLEERKFAQKSNEKVCSQISEGVE